MIFGSLKLYMIIGIVFIAIIISGMQIRISYFKKRYEICSLKLNKEILKNKIIEEEYNKSLKEIKEKEIIIKKKQKHNMSEIDKIMKEEISADCHQSIDYGIERAIDMAKKNN